MKVVIAALTAPTQLNGVSRHAASLACGLSLLASAPEIHFVAGAWQREMFSTSVALRHPRIHCHWVSKRNTNFNRLTWYYLDLPHIAAQLEADMIHYVCPAPLRVGHFKSPVVVSLHDLYPFEIPRNFGYGKGILNRSIMRQCLEGADAIACVSATTRRTLEVRLGQKIGKKAVTIFNIVEPDLRINPHAPLLLRDGRPFVLCVAQHRRNKNLPLALAIFQQALRENVVSAQTRLLIVGIPGPMTGEIHDQIRSLQIEHSVLMASGLSDSELQWCYYHCELLWRRRRPRGLACLLQRRLLQGARSYVRTFPRFARLAGICATTFP